MDESGQSSLFDGKALRQQFIVRRSMRAGTFTHCLECNRRLHNERSKWYGIGPECESRNKEVIDFTDIARGGSWEELHGKEDS